MAFSSSLILVNEQKPTFDLQHTGSALDKDQRYEPMSGATREHGKFRGSEGTGETNEENLKDEKREAGDEGELKDLRLNFAAHTLALETKSGKSRTDQLFRSLVDWSC